MLESRSEVPEMRSKRLKMRSKGPEAWGEAEVTIEGAGGARKKSSGAIEEVRL